MLRRRFDAMGTQMELVLDTAPRPDVFRALAGAEAEMRRLERLLSRFDTRSELSRLNERGSLVVSPELLEVVELALAARARTNGRFDPTVHDAVVAAGYDRSFEQLSEGDPRPARRARCGGAVHVCPRSSVVGLEEGVRLDLGGIAKGYAADRVAALLAHAGPCLVDAGGDIAVRGRAWPIGVETTDGTLTLEIAEGGLATSGRDRRRWRRGDEKLHHLIDPRTGRSAEGDLLRVTAAASSAAEAEALATMLFLSGAASAFAQAAREAIPAVLVTSDGRTLLAGGLA